MAIIGGIVAGLGIGGLLSVVLGNTQSMNTGVPVVLGGLAIGLGVGMIVAAAIGSESTRRA
jgi:hypothetical protein